MVLEFHSFACGCPVFPTPFIGDCLFPNVYSWLLRHKLIDHTCVDLFLGSHSVPFITGSVFRPIPYLFNYYDFVIEFEIRVHDASSSVILSQDYFCYSGFFCGSIQILGLFFKFP